MLYTTFAQLKKAKACPGRYKHLVNALKARSWIKKYGKKTPIVMLQILRHNGLDDCLWALRYSVNDEEQSDYVCRLFMVGCLYRVLHLYEASHNDLRQAVVAAHCFAASHAARAIVWDSARDAAWGIANAARTDAWNAAWDATRDATWADRQRNIEYQHQEQLLHHILEHYDDEQ